MMRRLGYQNACLTIIAALLALHLVQRDTGSVLEAPAQAQDSGGLSNALEQRKVMIAELRAMSSRLDRIEAKMNAGLEVRVKDMPPVNLSPEALRRLEGRLDAPAQASVIVPAPAAPGEAK